MRTDLQLRKLENLTKVFINFDRCTAILYISKYPVSSFEHISFLCHKDSVENKDNVLSTPHTQLLNSANFNVKYI